MLEDESRVERSCSGIRFRLQHSHSPPLLLQNLTNSPGTPHASTVSGCRIDASTCKISATTDWVEPHTPRRVGNSETQREYVIYGNLPSSRSMSNCPEAIVLATTNAATVIS